MTPEFAGSQYVIEVIYLIASALFILSLKWMSSPSTARHGILAGEIGMVLAIGGTLLHHGLIDYKWIIIGLVLGSGIGIPLGMVQMTAVPQRTALSHAFGALCVTLVGSAEFYLQTPHIAKFTMAVLSMEVILGGLTFTGSLIAAGKLQEVLPQRPITYRGQNVVNLLFFAVAIGLAIYLVFHPEAKQFFPVIVGIATGERPQPLTLLGIACAFPAIWLVSTSTDTAVANPTTARPNSDVADGLLAGLGFGLMFLALGRVPESAGLAPLAMAELSSIAAVVVLAMALRQSWLPANRAAWSGVVVGALAAAATVCFLFASQSGLLAVASVLASLYPAVTVLLATVVLHERIHRGQGVGLGLTLVAVVLVAAN